MLVVKKKQMYVSLFFKKVTLQQQRMSTFLRYLELNCCDKLLKFKLFVKKD